MARPRERAQRNERSREEKQQSAIDDDANKEFASRTLSLLAQTYEGNGLLSGEAKEDEERVAAALAFLQAQALEYLNLQMDLHGPQAADHPRARTAVYALEMIRDVIEETPHPIHRLFRGLNKRQPTNDVASRSFKKQSYLIACVEALLGTQEGTGQPRTWAMERMRENATLRPYVPEQDPFTTLLSRKAGKKPDGKPKDPLMRKAVRKHLSFMESQNISTINYITDWIAAQIGVWEKPLSMVDASRLEPRVQITAHGDGKGFSITHPPRLAMKQVILKGPPPQGLARSEP